MRAIRATGRERRRRSRRVSYSSVKRIRFQDGAVVRLPDEEAFPDELSRVTAASPGPRLSLRQPRVRRRARRSRCVDASTHPAADALRGERNADDEVRPVKSPAHPRHGVARRRGLRNISPRCAMPAPRRCGSCPATRRAPSSTTRPAWCVTGGVDVDPAAYRAPASAFVTETQPERDVFEIDVLRAARERGLPVLCICRGLQIANVAFGGTLIADVPQHLGDRGDARARRRRTRVSTAAGASCPNTSSHRAGQRARAHRRRDAARDQRRASPGRRPLRRRSARRRPHRRRHRRSARSALRHAVLARGPLASGVDVRDGRREPRDLHGVRRRGALTEAGYNPVTRWIASDDSATAIHSRKPSASGRAPARSRRASSRLQADRRQRDADQRRSRPFAMPACHAAGMTPVLLTSAATRNHRMNHGTMRRHGTCLPAPRFCARAPQRDRRDDRQDQRRARQLHDRRVVARFAPVRVAGGDDRRRVVDRRARPQPERVLRSCSACPIGGKTSTATTL